MMSFVDYSEGDIIHVDTCYIGCKIQHNFGINNRTGVSGHFMRSKVNRLYPLTNKYPIPIFNWKVTTNT